MGKRENDLRVIRTKRSIREAFYGMVMEMDYKDITVKALVERAMINRNTFYLHYSSIDDLLEELQNEIVEEFLSMYISYQSIEDIRVMIRTFFEYMASQPPVHERLLCSGSYRFAAININKKITAGRKELRHGALGISESAENIVYAYYGSVAYALFRQWVRDGKSLPLEDLIELSTNLICNGMSSVVKK